MALVGYSSTSESENESENKYECNEGCSSIKPKKLPLPSVISNMKTSTHESFSTTIDDPSQHDGRIRSFKHERGNWATFVYVAIPQNMIQDLQAMCQTAIKDLVDMKPISNVHISLSRTVVLQHHWINSFINSLQKTLIATKFTIQLRALKIYSNEEKTRTFIGFKVDDIYFEKLNNLKNKVDCVLEEFNLKQFYKDPSFHASILWCVGDNMKVLENIFHKDENTLNVTLEQIIANNDLNIHINEIVCKTGFKEFKFKLK